MLGIDLDMTAVNSLTVRALSDNRPTKLLGPFRNCVKRLLLRVILMLD